MNDNLLAALLGFLEDTRGKGWSGAVQDLKPLVGQYVIEATELPTYELGWKDALTQRASQLEGHGWMVEGVLSGPGHPVSFSRIPLAVSA